MVTERIERWCQPHIIDHSTSQHSSSSTIPPANTLYHRPFHQPTHFTIDHSSSQHSSYTLPLTIPAANTVHTLYHWPFQQPAQFIHLTTDHSSSQHSSYILPLTIPAANTVQYGGPTESLWGSNHGRRGITSEWQLSIWDMNSSWSLYEMIILLKFFNHS